jgi:hypothetical protein
MICEIPAHVTYPDFKKVAHFRKLELLMLILRHLKALSCQGLFCGVTDLISIALCNLKLLLWRKIVHENTERIYTWKFTCICDLCHLFTHQVVKVLKALIILFPVATVHFSIDHGCKRGCLIDLY